MSKRTQDQGKTPFAQKQHQRRDLASRLGKASEAYDVPDRARPSRVTEHVDPYENPTYYSTTSSETQRQDRVPDTPDIILTDYPNQESLSDMSKAPLFFGKPGQFEQVTTWCEISFLTNDELNHDKSKQAAFFASTFRGPLLSWLSRKANKDNLLRNYPLLKSEVQADWCKSETVQRTDAARRLSYIQQKRNVHGYALELDEIADILKLDDTTKEAIFKRGLKQHVKEALVSSDGYKGYRELVEEAERIDSELYSIRRPPRRNMGSKFAGKCNSCGQFGHKARDCRKGPKRESDW